MNANFFLISLAFRKADRFLIRHLPTSYRDAIYRLAYDVKFKFFSDERTSDVIQQSPTSRGVKRSGVTALPDVIVEDIKSVRKNIDPMFLQNMKLHPESYQTLYPHNPKVFERYEKLRSLYPKDTTHIVFAPWIKTGGADLVTIKHLEYLSEKKIKVVLMTTENADSTWIKKVPEDIIVVEVGKIIADLSEFDKIFLMATFIVQNRVRVIHVINSKLAWEVVKNYGKPISTLTKIFASVYCVDGYSKKGYPMGYFYTYGVPCDPYVSGWISDHKRYLNQLHEDFAISDKKIHAVYVPTRKSSSERLPNYGNKNILWAGRFDRQKRMDVLLKIVERCPDHCFHIYGRSVLGTKSPEVDQLMKKNNVVMYGAYDGFESLPIDKFAAYLYTSSWDGLPNTILESAARKLPVIAPRVGGIAEFVNDETGWLVENEEDIDSFVEAIEKTSNVQLSATKAEAAYDLLMRRHTWEEFSKSMSKIKDYIVSTK